MSGIDRDLCRRSAAECAVLARATTDPERKQLLLTRAQEWLKLAYSDHDAKFEGLLSEFNDGQLGLTERSAPARQTGMRRQPTQQSKQKPGRDG
jgi:hypothetical protein